MKWKEIAIGAVSTLFVTVLGGVGVYYWTKEPDTKKAELLYYSLNQAATFKSGTTNLGFNVARIENRGGVAARNVVLTVEYPGASITDYSIESPSDVKPKAQSVAKSRAEFEFDTLVPSEHVTVSFLTSAPSSPKISLRSSSSLGTPSPEETSKTSSRRERANEFVGLFIPIVGLISIVLAIPLFFVFRKYFGRIGSSRNNIAFLLLHQGLTEFAESILMETLQHGEDGPFALSNLALCRAKAGQIENANLLNRAAQFYAIGKHEKAVVAFNGALIALAADKKEEFFEKLKNAVLLSPKSIKEYCDYSSHLNEIKSDPRYAEVLRDA